MTHKTKGIVLRNVKYGETSIIVTMYTELFGVQSYIVKGIRQANKRGSSKAIYFQPAAILDMEVHHHPQKSLQFIKEYEWSFLYQHVLTDVVKNSVAMYIVEIFLHCLKQPEANPELYYLAEDTLKQLDAGNNTLTANLPLYFMLHLGGELGFRIQGEYDTETPIVDLYDGNFVRETPAHSYYVTGQHAKITSQLLSLNFYNDLENLALNRTTRRELLEAYQNYIALHVQDFGEIKSLRVLQEVLG